MKTYSIAIVLLMAVSAQSQGIINVDFYDSQFGYVPAYGPGAAAIGTTGDFWNSLDISTVGSLNGLKTSDGTVTSVGFTPAVNGFDGQLASGTYGLLFDIAVGVGSGPPNHLTQITGLTPNFQYELFLYSPDNPGINVNGISFSSPIANGPYNSLVEGINYSEHIVTADGSGNLDFVGLSEFSAFQLEAIPEPSTLALAALGASLLVAARPKKPFL